MGNRRKWAGGDGHVDLIAELGPLAFASRLKRLSDRLMRDVRLLYQRLDVGFDPRWFLFIYALHRRGSLSIADLARELGLTHTAIGQLATEISRTGMIASRNSQVDRRQRLLSLTAEGRAVVVRLEPVWEEIRSATWALVDESRMDFLGGMAALEASLDREDMFRRVWFKVDPRPPLNIVIEDYRPAYRKFFESLNREWIEECFEVKPEEEQILKDPRRCILKPGGVILFARIDGDVVGTCALIRHGNTFELSKLAVTRNARCLGVGGRLLEAALGRARAMGLEVVTLQTHPRFEAANRLFERFGFQRIDSSPIPDGFLGRARLPMRCDLNEQEVAW